LFDTQSFPCQIFLNKEENRKKWQQKTAGFIGGFFVIHFLSFFK